MTNMTVMPLIGGYSVKEHGNDTLFVVWRDHTCSCGKPDCLHLKAVRQHLKDGGQKSYPNPSFVVDRTGNHRNVIPQKPTKLKYHPNRDLPLQKRSAILMAKQKEFNASRQDSDINRYLYEATHVKGNKNKMELLRRWGLKYTEGDEVAIQEALL